LSPSRPASIQAPDIQHAQIPAGEESFNLNTDDLRREAAAPERLIEGEDPAATDTPTVEHWLLVYGQLLATKSGLLADLRKGMETMDPDARDEMVVTDEALLEAQVQRFRRRISFWESRLRRDG
jgi:hypothetical protein